MKLAKAIIDIVVPIRMAKTEIRHRILTTSVAVALPLFLSSITPSCLLAQAPAGQSRSQSTDRRAPQSLAEMAAAGFMAFDVASVKPNMSNTPANSRFPLGPGDAYVPNGAFFSATNQALIVYLRFAYKLGQSDLLGLPAWVYEDRFDIEARAQGNPTKDQVRLMMQSLLADRFKLSKHTEKRTMPVFDLVLAKAGKIGPQLQSHSEDGTCATASTPQTPGARPPVAPSAPSSTSGLQLPPIPCDSIGQIPASTRDRARLGGKRVTIARIAGFLTNPYTGVDRLVLDGTGLTGTFDFSLEWSLEPESTRPPGFPSEDTGPTFLEALQDQLGFKLKSTTGPVDVLVIDHVERSSPN
jgi:uncharacterized protein (TIGR03435 family)